MAVENDVQIMKTVSFFRIPKTNTINKSNLKVLVLD